jgi:hypothetical protein
LNWKTENRTNALQSQHPRNPFPPTLAGEKKPFSVLQHYRKRPKRPDHRHIGDVFDAVAFGEGEGDNRVRLLVVVAGKEENRQNS